jgi:hypothetical protein
MTAGSASIGAGALGGGLGLVLSWAGTVAGALNEDVLGRDGAAEGGNPSKDSLSSEG